MERVKKGIRHLILLIFFLSVTVLLLDRSGVLTELHPEREEASHRIVDAGTAWYYLEEGEDPGVGNVWTTERYRRGSWKELTGPYSGKGTSSGGEGASTAFFRTEFTYRPEEIAASFLSGRITYRDAVKVYLNGAVIFAGNVPDGGYESNLDSGAAEAGRGAVTEDFVVTDLRSLKKGENILSVELHKAEEGKGKTAFSFDFLDIHSEDHEETVPRADEILLQAGEKEDERVVTWLTSSEGYYQVEYLPAYAYRDEEHFSAEAESVLMERRKLSDGSYLNRGTMRKLRTGQRYFYRLLRVGGTEGSSHREFTMTRAGSCDFYAAAGIAGNRELLDDMAEKGDAGFLFLTGFPIGDDCFDMRRNPVFKAYASVLTHGAGETKEEENSFRIQFSPEDREADFAFTCQDVLIIGLQCGIRDESYHRSFISDAMRDHERKWTILLLDSEESLGEEVLLESGADVIVSRTGKQGIFLSEYEGRSILKVHMDPWSGEDLGLCHLLAERSRLLAELKLNGRSEELVLEK